MQSAKHYGLVRSSMIYQSVDSSIMTCFHRQVHWSLQSGPYHRVRPAKQQIPAHRLTHSCLSSSFTSVSYVNDSQTIHNTVSLAQQYSPTSVVAAIQPSHPVNCEDISSTKQQEPSPKTCGQTRRRHDKLSGHN
jgi:hypothetical protein